MTVPVRLIGAGINQRYVVELSSPMIARIEVDAASATEAETKAWSRFFDGVPPDVELEVQGWRLHRTLLEETEG
jgi:hypothetical protein